MFVGYQKFQTAFSGLFNSFSIHSEAFVTAVFHQVIVSNSFHKYRLKNLKNLFWKIIASTIWDQWMALKTRSAKPKVVATQLNQENSQENQTLVSGMRMPWLLLPSTRPYRSANPESIQIRLLVELRRLWPCNRSTFPCTRDRTLCWPTTRLQLKRNMLSF